MTLSLTDNRQEPSDNRQEPGTFTFDIQRATLETCDIEIFEWWTSISWPKLWNLYDFWQLKIFSFLTILTIFTILDNFKNFDNYGQFWLFWHLAIELTSALRNSLIKFYSCFPSDLVSHSLPQSIMVLILLKYKERPLRLLTFETFDHMRGHGLTKI